MAGEILKRLLKARGIAEKDFAAFLHPSLADLEKPEALPGVVEAADVVLAAVAAGREIIVFGDYDCDGVCATAIMVKTLSALDAKVSAFIPERLSEGYGMSGQSVDRMCREHPEASLVITVDNGINAIEEVERLSSLGVQVVVTDHHLPARDDSAGGKMLLPAAAALVCPKVSSPESLSSLCGAAVAFLLAQRIITEAKRRGIYSGPNIGGPLLVLAGVATVTDIMPLLDYNRVLVSEAIKRFREWAPIGLKELYTRAARIGSERLTSRDFGFLIGPRINAPGRMASCMESLELVLSDDLEISRELARIVDVRNSERREIEQRMSDDALAAVVDGASAQVIDLPDGHSGVAGIVAARLQSRLGVVPVFVIAGDHGSARAPDGFNVRDALAACSSVLERFGGHAAAGGFTVKEGKTDEFRRMMCDYCKSIQDCACAGESPSEEPDVWISESEVTLSLADEVALLEPYGEANEEPLFGLKDVMFSDVRPLGSEGRHLMLTLRGSKLKGIFWNRGNLVEQLRKESFRPHDVVFTLTVSEYGERHVELRIVSID